MAELEALAASPQKDATTFFPDAGVPGGLRIGDYVTQDGAKFDLTLRSTWTEGYRSAYLTGEIWKGFDEVWVQPVYVAITRNENGVLAPVPDADDGMWRPIFSVGPGSAFYSPFWRTFYFEVPDAASAENYKSARDVIDSGLPLIEGPAHTMSLVPGAPGDESNIVVPKASEDPAQEVGGPVGVSAGYLDGRDVSFLDFGQDNFAWNEDLVVEETPLYVLLYRDGDGNLHPMNVPTVAGTGPPYANRPVNVNNGVPHYGAYWRLYTVIVPATSLIFAPSMLLPGQRAGYAPAVVAPDDAYDPDVQMKADAGKYVGRVAVNPTVCFADYGSNFEVNDANHCLWLDNQQTLEAVVPPSDIERTDITVTCPFVSYRDVALTVTP